QRPCGRPPDQPPQTKPRLNSAEPRDKRLAADPGEKEKRRPPRSRQASHGRERDHPTGMPAEILKVRHGQSQHGRQHAAQTKGRRAQEQRRRDTGPPPRGPKRLPAAPRRPSRASHPPPATLKSPGWPSHAVRNVQAPENNNRPASTCGQGYRSETQPPKAYPLLMAARITPINAPQTNSEFPKTGAKSRLPKIS